MYWLGFLVAGRSVLTGLIYVSLAGILFGLSGGVSQAMVADLVSPEKHEAAYAAVRVASNLGVTLGPPVGALLLLVGGWTLEFVGVGLLAALAFALAFRYLPRRGTYAPAGPPERGSLGVIVRDRPFLLFLASGMLAWLVYVAYEVVLPDLADHDPRARAGGVGLPRHRQPGDGDVLPAAAHAAGRTRAAGREAGRRHAADGPAVPAPVGERRDSGGGVRDLRVRGRRDAMGADSQSVVAGLAPADLRGAYMGVFGSGAATGFALAPFFGLQIGDRYGDSTMWAFFAVASIVAAVSGAVAARGVRSRPESEGLAGEAAVA